MSKSIIYDSPNKSNCRAFKSNLNMIGLSRQFNSTIFWFTISSPKIKNTSKTSIHNLFTLLILFSLLLLLFLSNLAPIISPRLELPFLQIIILCLFNFTKPTIKRKISKTSYPFYSLNRNTSKISTILRCTFLPIISKYKDMSFRN